MKKVVILGAGYAGLSVLKSLNVAIEKNEVKVSLINKNAYHYASTNLHELAAGNVHDNDVSLEIRSIINDKVEFIQDEVVNIEASTKKIFLSRSEISYDILIVALGFETNTFGIEGVEKYAMSISSRNRASQIAKKIESNFISYKKTKDINNLKIAIAGLGLTGVEFAAEIVSSVSALCKKYNVDENLCNIYALNRSEEILPMFKEKQSKYAKKFLENNGVKLILGADIKEIKENIIVYEKDNERIELKVNTIVWSAGVKANKLMDETFSDIMKNGRVEVNNYLQAKSYEDIYIIGDCASFSKNDDKPYPPTAQIANQMGDFVGKQIIAKLKGKSIKSFVYKYRGTVCSLGFKDAIASSMGMNFSGFFASKMKKIIELVFTSQLSDFKTAWKKQRITK